MFLHCLYFCQKYLFSKKWKEKKRKKTRWSEGVQNRSLFIIGRVKKPIHVTLESCSFFFYLYMSSLKLWHNISWSTIKILLNGQINRLIYSKGLFFVQNKPHPVFTQRWIICPTAMTQNIQQMTCLRMIMSVVCIWPF